MIRKYKAKRGNAEFIFALSLRLAAILALAAPDLVGASIHDDWVDIRTCDGLRAFEGKYKKKNAYSYAVPNRRKKLCAQTGAATVERNRNHDRKRQQGNIDRTPVYVPTTAERALQNVRDADDAERRGDYVTARNLYTKACAEGSARGCNDLGLSYSNSTTATYGAPNWVASRAYFERACALQSGGAYCNNARIANSWSGFGAVKPPKIRYYFDQSGMTPQSIKCTSSNAEAECMALGKALLDSSLGPPQYAVARGLFIAACEVGSGEGCDQAGLSYGNSTRDTFGAVNYREAVRYFVEGCKLNYNNACRNVTVIHTEPSFGLVEPGIARTHWDKSRAPVAEFECRGRAEACRTLALSYTLPRYGGPAPENAFDLTSRACAAGSMLACQELGRLYHSGTGTLKNLNLAASFYERACNANIAAACASAGDLFGWTAFLQYNSDRARQFHLKACRGGIRASCEKSRLYRSG